MGFSFPHICALPYNVLKNVVMVIVVVRGHHNWENCCLSPFGSFHCAFWYHTGIAHI